MNYAIIIQCDPNSPKSQQGLKFCRALLEAGHKINRLFFYSEGVLNANIANVNPQDEADTPSEWQQFIQQNELDAVVCIAAALKRGILDNDEAQRHDKNVATLRDGFELSGLGQLAEAAVNSDRIITFA